MREFDDLKKIVGKLTEEEFRNELSLINVRPDKKSYYIQLIELVKEFPEIDAQEAQKHLYGRAKSIAFRQMVHRSKERLLDCLLLKDSIEKSPYYDDRAKEILILRKRLMQYDILNLRNLNDISIRFINKIIYKAKLFEYYDVLVIALYKKLRISLFISTKEDYSLQYKEIEHYEDCRVTFHKSEIYTRRLLWHVNSKENLIAHKKKLQLNIIELEADVVRTRSKSILYNLLILKVENNDMLEQYEVSKVIWRKIIGLLESNKHLNSMYGQGTAFINLGTVELRLFNFELAHDHFRKAFYFLKYLEPNKCVVYQSQFLLAFYSADTKNIEHFIDILNTYLYSGILVHYFAATVRYHNACLRFIQQDYPSSYLLLQDVRELEQEKESWNISIRILSILNQIELENFELADSLIENLRKHHERVRKTLPITKRDQLIIQILVALSRHSFNFRKTFRLKGSSFHHLDSIEAVYAWKILSPEMIVFNEWFKAKLEAKKYDHFEVMPAMKKKFASLHKGFVPLASDAESPQYN